jgi:hypothetical protein
MLTYLCEIEKCNLLKFNFSIGSFYFNLLSFGYLSVTNCQQELVNNEKKLHITWTNK